MQRARINTESGKKMTIINYINENLRLFVLGWHIHSGYSGKYNNKNN